jgi:hypothetical protein
MPSMKNENPILPETDTMQEELKQYLKPTLFLDYDRPVIADFANAASALPM